MEIKERINSYECGEDFTPLQITFKVKPPIYLTSPFLHLDSILKYLCLRDCLNEDFYSLPSEYTINTEDLKIPLKRTEDVYHSSVAQFKQSHVVLDRIYKRFTDKEVHHLTSKQNKGRVSTNKGYFKDFLINYPLLLCNELTFYCCGDKKELNKLLPHLSMIGKKTSIGSGAVIHYNITETTEDYSFFKDGEIMRPLPTSFKIPVIKGMSFQKQPYKPPYWDKNNVSMCYVPKSQIRVGL